MKISQFINQEQLNKNLCYELYSHGNTQIDEALGISTLSRYINSLMKKIDKLKATDSVDENTVSVMFQDENERIIETFSSTPNTSSMYIGLPAISLTEVNLYLQGKFSIDDIENVRIINNQNGKLKRVLTLKDYNNMFKNFKYLVVFKIDKNMSTARRYNLFNNLINMPSTKQEVFDFFSTQKKVVVTGSLVGVLDLREKTNFNKAIVYPDLFSDEDAEDLVKASKNMDDDDFDERVKEIFMNMFNSSEKVNNQPKNPQPQPSPPKEDEPEQETDNPQQSQQSSQQKEQPKSKEDKLKEILGDVLLSKIMKDEQKNKILIDLLTKEQKTEREQQYYDATIDYIKKKIDDGIIDTLVTSLEKRKVN